MTARVWNSARQLTLNCEGGFQCNPADDGNWTGGSVGKGKLVGTNHGISAAAYPHEDIVNMTQERAEYLYKRDYWDRCKCDQLPDCLSVAVFDFAVNSGDKVAKKKLQKALGVTDDGIIGNQTIGAANRLNPRKVLEEYKQIRLKYVDDIIKRDKKKEKYRKGWNNRIAKVFDYCERLI